MPDPEQPEAIDWSLTSFDGARREQMRRWAQLPLERILLAVEEMQDISEQLRVGDQATQAASGEEQ